MNKRTGLIGLFLILLFAQALNSADQPVIVSKNNIFTTPDMMLAATQEKYYTEKNTQNSSIDGATSASKLRAKSSHAVSKEDETGLVVFLGIIFLAVILFFVNQFGEK